MGGQNKQKSIFGLLHPPLTLADKALYYSTIYPNSRDLGTTE